MNGILLVAGREYRQIAKTQSFWLILLMVPLLVILGPLMAGRLGADDTRTVTIVDQSGAGTGSMLARRLEAENDIATMTALASYARRHHLDGTAWGGQQKVPTPADAAAFRAAGGADAALQSISRKHGDELPSFMPPTLPYEVRSGGTDLAGPSTDRAFATAAQVAIDRAPNKGRDEVMVRISADHAATGRVQVVSGRQLDRSTLQVLREELDAGLKEQAMRRGGMNDGDIAAARGVSAQIAFGLVGGRQARDELMVRSSLPLIIALSLFLGLTLSGNWMLQGSTEERSNKLIEGVLACMRPESLMYGKLAGTLAIGMTIFGSWLAAAAVAIVFVPSGLSDYLSPALESVSSPKAVATLAYFFVGGYLSVSILYMMIGAVSETMSDAQAYLMPVVFLVMGPFIALQRSIVDNNVAWWGEIATWVPLWSPFLVLARLGNGMATWEVVGIGVLLAVFIAVQLVLLGRMFRTSLLHQGQKRGWQRLLTWKLK